MFLLAYASFVLLLFLPGIAFLEASQAGRSLSLGERLGLALGLGMAIDVLILLLRAYSFVGLTYYYLGEGYADLGEVIAAISAIMIGVTVAVRRRSAFYVTPTRMDLIVGVLVLAQGLLVFAHYTKYPIFPQFPSIDFSQHVMLVSDLARSPPSPSNAILYYGVHLLMVDLLGLSHGPAFVITQRTMEILVVLSPLLVYAAASAVWDSKPVPLVATFVYVAGGFVWFGSVFNAGLYPNFYGILSTLLILVAVSITVREPGRWSSWLVYFVSVGNALFSHYTTLLIFPTLVALPIVGLILTRRTDKRLLAAALVPMLLSGIVFVLLPSLLTTLESFVSVAGGTNVGGSTPVSRLLVGSPFASLMAAEITSDVSTVFLFAFAIIGAYLSIKRKSTLSLIPLGWFLTLAVVSPPGGSAWRFSYAALMPLCMLAAFGFEPLLAKRRAVRERVRRKKYSRTFPGGGTFSVAAPVVMLISVVVGTWGTLAVADALDQGWANGQAQRDVYASMLWLAKNTPSDSKILSITDWRYNYTNVIVGHTASYSPLADPDGVLQQVMRLKHVYVALTEIATVPQGSENPLPAYSNNPNFQLVYSNSDVMIYLVKGNSSLGG